MRILLDTHVFLRMQTEPEWLGRQLRLLESSSNRPLVSAATSWEIAIKYAGGRLPLPEPPDRYVPDRIRAIGGTPIAIEHPHALAAGALPSYHRDPFDRLLIAQAQALNVPILTADAMFGRYDVDVIALY